MTGNILFVVEGDTTKEKNHKGRKSGGIATAFEAKANGRDPQ